MWVRKEGRKLNVNDTQKPFMPPNSMPLVLGCWLFGVPFGEKLNIFVSFSLFSWKRTKECYRIKFQSHSSAPLHSLVGLPATIIVIPRKPLICIPFCKDNPCWLRFVITIGLDEGIFSENVAISPLLWHVRIFICCCVAGQITNPYYDM